MPVVRAVKDERDKLLSRADVVGDPQRLRRDRSAPD